jgi:hypothetical protein
MTDDETIYSKHVISAQQWEQYSGHQLDMLEDALIGNIRELFLFMRKNGIDDVKQIDIGSLQFHTQYSPSMMAHEIVARLRVMKIIDPSMTYGYGKVQVSSHMAEMVQEYYADQIKSQLAAEPLLNPETITAEDLKKALASKPVSKPPPPPPPPPPLTYEDLKKKAVAEGKIAAPPVDKGDGLI